MSLRSTLEIPISPATALWTVLALSLGAGWAAREAAFAREGAERVASRTVTLDEVAMKEDVQQGTLVGKVGFYIKGDTPASRDFVTGRYVIEPGKTPHAPHRHVEEEVMIVEGGTGEIFCDGKTTRVGPGSVMFTEPNAPHGINNTGDGPLTFYFIKWAPRGSK